MSEMSADVFRTRSDTLQSFARLDDRTDHLEAKLPRLPSKQLAQFDADPGMETDFSVDRCLARGVERILSGCHSFCRRVTAASVAAHLRGNHGSLQLMFFV